MLSPELRSGPFVLLSELRSYELRSDELRSDEFLPEFLPELLTPKVLQAWFRLGSGLVQAWFRLGSGLVQTLFI